MDDSGGRSVRKIFSLLPFVLLLSVVSSDNLQSHSHRGYMVLAPAVFRSGVNQTITVRIFDNQNSVLVKATIVDWREQSIIASEVSRIQGSGKITLKVPKGVKGKATLQVCGNCHEHATFRFQNSTTITIINKGTSAFLQTDKPIYKPSQRVQINVYTVDRDLRPVIENVTVYAKAPNDVKIIEWKNLRPACCGTITTSFPLSDQPPFGEWKIFAELQGNVYNTTFEVSKYVLPKFDVTITPPSSFRDFSICEEAIVTAKYAFGKPVKGTLSVNMTVTGFGYLTRDLERVDTTTQTMPFRGESRFSVCLQDNLGRKTLNRHFRGTLAIWATVTGEDGSHFSAFDDTTIVSRNLVELEFTVGTRKHFKHGIPFQGQIFASYLNGTGAKRILIELKAEDSRETFMTQQLLSPSDGIISFTIPALPQSTKFLWLETRVIAIDGVFTDRHQYLAVYHDLHSWHSPSRCHLLVEKPKEKLMVNKPTTLLVKSTCPCDFTLFYEFLSRGDIILSNSFPVNITNSHYLEARKKRSAKNVKITNHSKRHTQAETHICQTIIRVTPTPNMAPLAKLLTYYVRPNGEGVADSIHLPVEPTLENDVKIKIPKEFVSPGEKIDVSISASKGSCVCLGATDKSLHFIAPEYLLSKDEIFDEVYSYDLDNLPFEEEHWERPSTLRRRRSRWRRSSHGHQQLLSLDSFHAFLEAGLVVMTDVVSLKHKQNIQVFSEFRLHQALGQAQPVRPRSSKSRKLRSFFPETWYWECFNISSGGENTITLKVPDTVTSWVVNAVGTSPGTGIGVAENIAVTTFKAFFVEFNMPYSATRGEEMELPVTVHNYLDVCVEVRLVVAAPSGVTFSNAVSKSARKVIRHVCVGPGSTETTSFKLAFSNLGNSKVLAVADAVEGPNQCCSVENELLSKVKGNVVGRDTVVKQILVEAEGEPREYIHSVFFCPNERMNITTPPSTFHFVKLPKNESSFSFLTRAPSNIHVAFTADEEISDSSYEIILGGHGNTMSWIQRNNEILVSTATENVLSLREFRSFWIQWTEGNITVGYGMENTKLSGFLYLEIPEQLNALYVGLATTSQSKAEFRLWSTEDLGDGFSEVFQLDVPSYAVAGSIRGRATVIGDVMGPTLRNLNNLLKLPYGCGEQNMINFAPNIHILNYLKSTNQLTREIEREAREYLVQGYQRQLTYRRQSGSYSAFGDRDQFGSMWLTAFVMKSYAEAKEFIYVDQQEIDQAMKWILIHQTEEGSFPAHGKILNKDVQGGINRKIALTAYVVIALLETEADNQDKDEAVDKAVSYLVGMLYGYQDPYTAALTAYALTLAESSFAAEARTILLDMSVTSGSGSHRYWSLKSHFDAKLFSPTNLFAFLSATKQTVASAEIELASYALLAFTKSEEVSVSLPIVKWISQQRNSQGGFSSTQDTCTALQALSSYASFAYIGGVNLEITLEGPDSYNWNVILNNSNSEILQTGNIPPIGPTSIPVFVKAKGYGCALLQIHVQFNIPEPDDKKEFSLQVSMTNEPTSPVSPGSLLKRKRDSGELVRPVVVEPEPPLNIDSHENADAVETRKKYYIRVCGRWLNHGSSNMAILEVPLLTGYAADIESLTATLSNKTKSLKRFEVEHSNIIFYFDEISSVCKTCVSFEVRREYEVANLSPKVVKLYDYYEPGYESSRAYNVENLDCQGEEGCMPSNIELEDGFPECKCYRECDYEGPRVCGDDGNMYPNLCRLEVASCEMDRPILQQNDALCEDTEEEATLEPPVIPIPDYYEENYDNLFEQPDSEFVEGLTSYY